MPFVSLDLLDKPTQMLVDGDGPAVVLLHGSADSPGAWLGVTLQLRGVRSVFAPALPPQVAAKALDSDLPWLDALMAHTGARVLAGHSYGALLALRWALAHPGALDRLILCEPIAWGIARQDPKTALRLAELDAECLARFVHGDTLAGMEWLVDYWNGDGFWARLPEKVRAALLAGFSRTWAEVACGSADRTNPQELSTLATPTWLLAGAQSTPESLKVAHLLAQAIPDAQLQVLQGAGHQFLRSHAAQVVAAILGVSPVQSP